MFAPVAGLAGEWLGLLVWLTLAAGAPPGLVLGGDATRLWPRPALAAGFDATTRAVGNWRFEAARAVEADAARSLRFVLGDGADLPRCIRLNNYWCVKRAGWAGEIAADREGHVAFASAREGALVAALLLRRYYVDFGRKAASDIVSRWAPAECSVAGARGAPLARRGVGATLRARWLARNRPGFTGPRMAGKKGALRRSVVADRPAPMLRAPSIAAGMGERAPAVALASGAVNLAALGAPAASRAPSCGGDVARIANYAGQIAAAVALAPGDDLGLFDSAGEPTPRLAPVLRAMAGVEIGPYAVEPDLVRQAVDDLVDDLARRRAEAAPAPVNPPRP
ncbi:MAG: hypothetical protein IPL88_06675 [Rhizobiales bacterium]|nr:hypothetical protein [Hyphomicrobiales bacterium]